MTQPIVNGEVTLFTMYKNIEGSKKNHLKMMARKERIYFVKLQQLKRYSFIDFGFEAPFFKIDYVSFRCRYCGTQQVVRDVVSFLPLLFVDSCELIELIENVKFVRRAELMNIQIYWNIIS